MYLHANLFRWVNSTVSPSSVSVAVDSVPVPSDLRSLLGCANVIKNQSVRWRVSMSVGGGCCRWRGVLMGFWGWPRICAAHTPELCCLLCLLLSAACGQEWWSCVCTEITEEVMCCQWLRSIDYIILFIVWSLYTWAVWKLLSSEITLSFQEHEESKTLVTALFGNIIKGLNFRWDH